MVANHFEKELGTRLSKSTISDILKNPKTIESAPDRVRFRARAAKYPELEDCVYM